MLFDTSVILYFISISFAFCLQLEFNSSTSSLLLSMPRGRVTEISMICGPCCLVIEHNRLFADICVIAMDVFDIILSKDWLAKYRSMIDYFRR